MAGPAEPKDNGTGVEGRCDKGAGASAAAQAEGGDLGTKARD